MKAADLEKVEHFTKELKKLIASERAFADAPQYIEFRFPGGLADDGPAYKLEAGDEHYQSVVTLARLQNKQDIAEVRAALKNLGVDVE